MLQHMHWYRPASASERVGVRYSLPASATAFLRGLMALLVGSRTTITCGGRALLAGRPDDGSRVQRDWGPARWQRQVGAVAGSARPAQRLHALLRLRRSRGLRPRRRLGALRPRAVLGAAVVDDGAAHQHGAGTMSRRWERGHRRCAATKLLRKQRGKVVEARGRWPWLGAG